MSDWRFSIDDCRLKKLSAFSYQRPAVGNKHRLRAISLRAKS